MNSMTLRDRLIDEVQRIPETHLEEVFDLLHFFRVGLESSKQQLTDTPMNFAGAWQDMDDGSFSDFQAEIAMRRHQAFSDRRADDADLG